MLRGIDKRNIFLDDEDRIKFLEKLFKAKETAEFKLFGYCLMDNHVHLLIEENEPLGTSIKRITVGYVQWHNKKYERTGHLFQNRYLSEPVQTEDYLLNVLRYIHQNPVKAGITNNPEYYLWSSYEQYISAYHNKNTPIDTKLIKSYFKEVKNFEEYMNILTKDEFLEYKPAVKSTDSILKAIIEKEIDISVLHTMPIKERDEVIKNLYQRTGASLRQLEKFLGIGKNVVARAIKKC